jgi:hypothetical protein
VPASAGDGKARIALTLQKLARRGVAPAVIPFHLSLFRQLSLLLSLGLRPFRRIHRKLSWLRNVR